MVIRREDSGVSSLKKSRAWRWPPQGSVAVPTRVHVDRFSKFSKGVKWGDLGDDQQKLKQNVTLLYPFILTFSVLKKFSGIHRKRGWANGR